MKKGTPCLTKLRWGRYSGAKLESTSISKMYQNTCTATEFSTTDSETKKGLFKLRKVFITQVDIQDQRYTSGTYFNFFTLVNSLLSSLSHTSPLFQKRAWHDQSQIDRNG